MSKNFMKTFVIVITAIVVLIIIGLIIVLVAGLNGKNFFGDIKFGYSSAAAELRNEITVDASDAEKIDSRFSMQSAEYFTHSSDTIIVREYMNFEPEESEKTTLNASNGEVLIRGGDLGGRMMNMIIRVEIYIPENFNGDFIASSSSGSLKCAEKLDVKSFKAESTSGSIKFESIETLDNIKASASSGSVKLGTVKATVFEAETTSGSIKLDTAVAKDIKLSSVSGGISADTLSGAQDISTSSGSVKISSSNGSQFINTTSGSIKIEDFNGVQQLNSSSGSIRANGSGHGSYASTSGSIRVEYNSIDGDVEMTASSGSIGITVPHETGITLKASSSSGSLHTFFDDVVYRNDKNYTATYGSGEINVSMKTTSGSINID